MRVDVPGGIRTRVTAVKGRLQAVDYGAGSTPVSVGVGDFNRDGRLDLVVADSAFNVQDGNLSALLQVRR